MRHLHLRHRQPDEVLKQYHHPAANLVRGEREPLVVNLKPIQPSVAHLRLDCTRCSYAVLLRGALSSYAMPYAMPYAIGATPSVLRAVLLRNALRHRCSYVALLTLSLKLAS
eukprot:scaffold117995_cov32-Tisochrysis_lutea.AAC.7